MKVKIERLEELVSLGFRRGPNYYNYGYCKVSRETGAIFLEHGNTGYSVSIPPIVIKLIQNDFIENLNN